MLNKRWDDCFIWRQLTENETCEGSTQYNHLLNTLLLMACVWAVGQIFDPTDEEIVGYYLRNMLSCGGTCFDEIERCLVREADLYGSMEPWEIWDLNGGRQLEERDAGEGLYFFTRKKRVSLNGSRICRRVGSSGTWAGDDCGQTIFAGDVVGIKKRFRYENPDSPHHGDWIMHEFSIDQNDIVVCRLKKNVRAAAKKRKLQACNSEQQGMQFKRSKFVPSEPPQVGDSLSLVDPAELLGSSTLDREDSWSSLDRLLQSLDDL